MEVTKSVYSIITNLKKSKICKGLYIKPCLFWAFKVVDSKEFSLIEQWGC
jgi:hypothetical protein